MKSIFKKVVTPIVSSALILLISISVVSGGLIFAVNADSIKDPTKIASGTSNTVTYLYDESGKRIMKEENGKKTYYVNDLYEEDSDGTVRKYIYANGVKVATIGSSIGSSTGSSTVFNHQDHLGGSNVSTDSSGKVVEVNDYYPYGSSRIEEKTGSYANNKLYTGKELDKSTGLYYYGARYYDPLIGRFTSVDPWSGDLTNPQTLNKYSYVTNNPMRYVDPTGMYMSEVHLDLTMFLAEQAGFSSMDALTIGLYNQLVDTTPSTEPGLNVENYANGTTQKYHFANYTDAVKGVTDAIGEQDLISFGQALHTFQDTYSHTMSPAKHVLLTGLERYLGVEGTDPDKTQNKPRAAKMMAYNTYMYMREYSRLSISDEKELIEFDQQTKNIWNNTKETINSFIISEDKNKKELLKKSTNEDDKDTNNN